MIISKTPLRISFAGGGTDLPSFYKHNKYGAVLSTSIDSYIYVSIKKHTEIYTEKIRLNYSDTEMVDDIDSIKNPIIRECLKFIGVDDRIYISTISDIPASTGLGSSSSFCVGLLNALYKFKGIDVSIGQIVEEAAHIEINILKRPIGKQDHYAAAYGGLNYFRFNNDGLVTVHPVPMTKNNFKILFDSMLSFWTGLTRSAETILEEQDRNNQKNTEILFALRAQAEEIFSLMTQESFSIKEFGNIIHKGWIMKKKLASNISSTFIDSCYDIAMGRGAYGGKISGAGGGGFLNVFSGKKDQRRIVDSLRKKGLTQINFSGAPLGTTVNKLD